MARSSATALAGMFTNADGQQGATCYASSGPAQAERRSCRAGKNRQAGHVLAPGQRTAAWTRSNARASSPANGLYLAVICINEGSNAAPGSAQPGALNGVAGRARILQSAASYQPQIDGSSGVWILDRSGDGVGKLAAAHHRTGRRGLVDLRQITAGADGK